MIGKSNRWIALSAIPILIATSTISFADDHKEDKKSYKRLKDHKKKDHHKKHHEDDDHNSDDNNNSGGGHTNPPNPNTSGYMLTAWNDLGMHCMDGNDFSVFSILPPYNNLHAQLKDKNGDLVTNGVTITYEATMGTDGKINTSSSDKTNFWDYSQKLFGVALSPNI
jgi:hypothetical protein